MLSFFLSIHLTFYIYCFQFTTELFSQIIIFLFLIDSDTSLLVTIPVSLIPLLPSPVPRLIINKHKSFMKMHLYNFTLHSKLFYYIYISIFLHDCRHSFIICLKYHVLKIYYALF